MVPVFAVSFSVSVYANGKELYYPLFIRSVCGLLLTFRQFGKV
jgi:hypothetical protein